MTDITPAPERWLPIPGYEGYYEASDLGRVRSLPRRGSNNALHAGRILKPQRRGPRGYLGVTLSVHGKAKGYYMQRLIAATFLGPRPDGMDVCHKDDDKTNNRATNLKYDTHAANQREASERGLSAFGERNGMVRLGEAQVAEIRMARAAGVRGIDLARQYGISKAQVSRIGTGRNWAQLPGAIPELDIQRGERNVRALLTAEDVRAIRAARTAGAGSSELARRYGVSQPTISQIIHRKTWKHVE